MINFPSNKPVHSASMRSRFTNALLVILAGGAFFLSSCSKKNVHEIKEAAPAFLKTNGFEIVGYQGYQRGTFETYGGKVWYTLKKIPDNGIMYQACVTKWGNEYHLYYLQAVDAIKPGRSR